MAQVYAMNPRCSDLKLGIKGKLEINYEQNIFAR
jgi:hypothetical protein